MEAYIERQLGKESLVHEAVGNELRPLTIVNSDIDLSGQTVTKRGRYWDNLHLVLSVQERWRIDDLKCQTGIRDQCLKSAAQHGYALSRSSIVPDHAL